MKLEEDLGHTPGLAHTATAIAHHLKPEEVTSGEGLRPQEDPKPVEDPHPEEDTNSEEETKSEEDKERAVRTAYLYSLPPCEPADEAMEANSSKRKRESNTKGESDSTQNSFRERFRPRTTRSIPIPGPERSRLIGSKLKNGKIRINTILAIPGTDKKTYKRGDNSYVCPKGIEPWTSRHRWMLDPEVGIFKQDVAFPFHWYMPERVMTDSDMSDGYASQGHSEHGDSKKRKL